MSAVHNYGRNDGRWIGMILPFDSQKDQLGGNSRGVRYRVAIMGVTPFAQGEIKNEDITFALVKMVGGSGGGGTFDTVKYSPGDAVTGYYLDDERQQPVIDGCFGRTRGIKYGSGRFDAKSGFVGKIVPLNLMGRQEFNEQDSPCTPKAKPSGDKSTSRQQPAAAAEIGAAGPPKLDVLPPPPVTYENSVMQNASQGLSDPGNPNSPVIGSEVGG